MSNSEIFWIFDFFFEKSNKINNNNNNKVIKIKIKTFFLETIFLNIRLQNKNNFYFIFFNIIIKIK